MYSLLTLLNKTPRAKKWRGGGQKQIVRADGILSPKPPGFRPPSPGVEQSETQSKKKLWCWIFGEKSSNFDQKTAQNSRKLKIGKKRRRKCRKWRAGRNSPLKPPFRPARIFVGRFGNCGDKCKRRARRKNEGAVACRGKK